MSSVLPNNPPNVLSSFTPLERSDLLAETIVKQIMGRILENVLQPGDQLAEASLAEQFGVSRIPVREALSKLERFGLVHKEPYQLAVVSALTDQDLEELHCVRLLIEPWAARILAAHRLPEDLAILAGILTEMEQAVQHEQRSEMVQLDLRLHNALVTLTHNTLLNEMWSLASMRLQRFLLLKRRRAYPNLVAAIDLHRPLVEAIAAGRPDEAEAETRRHLLDVYHAWQEDPYRLAKPSVKD